ncbi:efflux RND transporter periplasmic adaptor subunit [Sphingomonas mucosissima]|uniref:Multidrug resistance protein MdtA n=1 Tax=Sphingomonas mucosissima TaxID=370959 RepID=A0A245ZJS1_9SPHN|nr:efflux RND transporter periplasmic adaptor subunit [Sphingomonas mucosissima]OWK29976.1 multidrug resistance protein MdtA precursor [Sphingomonas mucosissima]
MHRLIAATLSVSLVACSGSKEEEQAPQQDVVSVQAAQVGSDQVQSWVYGQGTARAVRREFLTFTAEGRVTYIAPGMEVGRPVRRGQLIASLQPERVQADLTVSQSELTSARAAQREAAATLELARVTLERYRKLIAQRSASAQEFDQAQAEYTQALAAKRRADAQATAGAAQVAQQQVIFSETRLVSPINGVLGRLNLERGRLFAPSTVQSTSEQSALRTVPALVIDPSSFEIRADLPATAFRDVVVGSEVLIGAGPAQIQAQNQKGGNDERFGREAGPSQPVSSFQLRGRVYAISPSLDPDTRTFEAVIRTTTPRPPLQDGEFVALWMARPLGGRTPVVPLGAIRYRNDRPFVFVVDAQAGVARERPVQLGVQGDGRQAILRGVRAGERVVTAGRAQLSDGQRIRIVQPQRASQPKAQGAAR